MSNPQTLHHYIMLKYRPGVPDAHVDEFCQRMMALTDSIPELNELDIGRDILHEERSWSLLLSMRFDSIEQLRAYQQHPAHQAVMGFNAPWVSDVAAIDFWR